MEMEWETKGVEEEREESEETWEVRDSEQGLGCWKRSEEEDAQLAPLAFCTILNLTTFLSLAAFWGNLAHAGYRQPKLNSRGSDAWLSSCPALATCIAQFPPVEFRQVRPTNVANLTSRSNFTKFQFRWRRCCSFRSMGRLRDLD